MELTYQSGASTSTSDCDSLASDVTYTYAYADGYALVSYYGDYYEWAYGDFDGSQFTYAAGYVDYYYANEGGYYEDYEGYNTNYWEGSAILK